MPRLNTDLKSTDTNFKWCWAASAEMFSTELRECFTSDNGIDAEKFNALVDEPYADCLTFPLLSEDYCDWLVDYSEILNKWCYNPEDEYAAWETPQKKFMPAVYNYHETYIINGVFGKIIQGLYDYSIGETEHAFLIKYDSGHNEGIDWHYDENSTFSASVNLNDDFSGGELCFLRGGPAEGIKLPKGHAILFPGSPVRTHKSNPIGWGSRYVQVYWIR